MRNLLIIAFLISGSMAIAQKPNYNPNQAPVKAIDSFDRKDGLVPQVKFRSSINSTKALFIVNGKRISSEEYRLIDPEKIKSVKVYKPAQAREMLNVETNYGMVVIEAEKNWNLKKKKDDNSSLQPLIAG